jgi:hypothetical protein
MSDADLDAEPIDLDEPEPVAGAGADDVDGPVAVAELLGLVRDLREVIFDIVGEVVVLSDHAGAMEARIAKLEARTASKRNGRVSRARWDTRPLANGIA